ncbi:hypothetical protein FISHEDRAFT_61026 [Fistulina hepatica ATCC 64428]|uniref:Uncharacterized protein n=1 Tax=Fistulina hepatica ATCC 64428 TaxID=1128425 RepID=A0A0D7A4G1_9AGAR|nr:hypothetical protein FISHEDRAFT_61026 [Fistulina hepatica ATCC 64428]
MASLGIVELLREQIACTTYFRARRSSIKASRHEAHLAEKAPAIYSYWSTDDTLCLSSILQDFLKIMREQQSVAPADIELTLVSLAQTSKLPATTPALKGRFFDIPVTWEAEYMVGNRPFPVTMEAADDVRIYSGPGSSRCLKSRKDGYVHGRIYWFRDASKLLKMIPVNVVATA